jgi:hypothetical protein
VYIPSSGFANAKPNDESNKAIVIKVVKKVFLSELITKTISLSKIVKTGEQKIIEKAAAKTKASQDFDSLL